MKFTSFLTSIRSQVLSSEFSVWGSRPEGHPRALWTFLLVAAPVPFLLLAQADLLWLQALHAQLFVPTPSALCRAGIRKTSGLREPFPPFLINYSVYTFIKFPLYLFAYLPAEHQLCDTGDTAFLHAWLLCGTRPGTHGAW